MERSLTSSQMGCFISFSTWQALVVTELTPEHHSTEKSQGWFTTYKLTEMLSWRYCLRGDSCGQSSRQQGVITLCTAIWVCTSVHLGYDPAFAATWSDCLDFQTEGRFAGRAEDCSQLHPLHQPCLTGVLVHKPHTQLFPAAHQYSAPSPLLAPGTVPRPPQLPGTWTKRSHLISSELMSW